MLVMARGMAEAQTLSANTDSLSWKISSFHNITRNTDVAAVSEFRSNQSVITWIQNLGEDINEFNISSRDGSWPDVAQNGSVVFNVTWNALSGTIQFARTGDQITISLVIYKDGVNITPFTFSATEVVKY